MNIARYGATYLNGTFPLGSRTGALGAFMLVGYPQTFHSCQLLQCSLDRPISIAPKQ
jgi:hypothetical protein